MLAELQESRAKENAAKGSGTDAANDDDDSDDDDSGPPPLEDAPKP
jgi:hypothetical protein